MGIDEHPQLFANHVIAKMVAHAMGDETVVERDDFTSMRVVFRERGGSWVALADGDISQVDRLRGIVKAWGKLPGRFKKTDWVI